MQDHMQMITLARKEGVKHCEYKQGTCNARLWGLNATKGDCRGRLSRETRFKTFSVARRFFRAYALRLTALHTLLNMEKSILMTLFTS